MNTLVADTAAAPYASARWIRIQWPAILGGAIAGFGTALLMTSLGGALGMTITAAALANPGTDGREAAAGVGIGVIVWSILTAIVVGLVGGAAMKHLAVRDESYRPVIFGLLNWTCGVAFALLLASSSMMGGALGAVAGGGTVVHAGMARGDDGMRIERTSTNANSTIVGSTSTNAMMQPTAAEREMAEDAAQVASSVAWLVIALQAISLVVTILAAGRRGNGIVVVATPVHAPV